MFLHHIKAGPASKSFGIQVASLAGVPDTVIQLAKDKLNSLEQEKINDSKPETSNPITQENVDEKQKPAENDEITKQLKQINVDEITPRQALDVLYQLQKLLRPQ